jgi:hypothetical protein
MCPLKYEIRWIELPPGRGEGYIRQQVPNMGQKQAAQVVRIPPNTSEGGSDDVVKV